MEEKLILDGSKVLWHKERIEQWKRGEKFAPITIDCALTTKCSYRCIYCYGKMQCINQSDNLDKETIFNFLEDAAEIGVKAVSFVSDGESTCNPNLKDAIVYGKSLGLDMALGTNGFLLKDEELEEILPCLTYLRFNISAGEADRYAYIHGVDEKCYHKVVETMKKAVAIRKEKNLPVTIGTQMVLMPELADQIMPLAKLGKEIGVDYFVIKHCSDDEEGTLGIDYSKYDEIVPILKEAEALSTENYQVSAKWSKILSHGKKNYCKCFGAPFILQMSGTGLVAPCGMFFNEKYSKYHIGNIKEKRFKEIFESDRYWEVMKSITSEEFDPNRDCGTLCLQHKTNEVLWSIYQNDEIPNPVGEKPNHINFI
ncbi:Radical SAM superfamily enzyme, MoaA/NifB/PqqE/SkfB family [Lachnospiraceae bacterium XBB1006]|nr:Radical SAM superfamily enzyme, MoaA/NifB/PqqE/SkfB family [Lachnospiraceae bacterium XBB1006]